MEIRDINDAGLIAGLNKPLLDMHVSRHPLVFKPFDEESVTAYFNDCISRPEFIHIGAFEGDELVGFLQGEIKEKPDTVFSYPIIYLHIHQMYVLANHRKKGIGRSLLDTIRKRAKKLGIKKIIVAIWDIENNMIDYYKSYGFEISLTSMHITI